jgi:hypothetical protein
MDRYIFPGGHRHCPPRAPTRGMRRGCPRDETRGRHNPIVCAQNCGVQPANPSRKMRFAFFCCHRTQLLGQICSVGGWLSLDIADSTSKNYPNRGMDMRISARMFSRSRVPPVDRCGKRCSYRAGFRSALSDCRGTLCRPNFLHGPGFVRNTNSYSPIVKKP